MLSIIRTFGKVLMLTHFLGQGAASQSAFAASQTVFAASQTMFATVANDVCDGRKSRFFMIEKAVLIVAKAVQKRVLMSHHVS